MPMASIFKHCSGKYKLLKMSRIPLIGVGAIKLKGLLKHTQLIPINHTA